MFMRLRSRLLFSYIAVIVITLLFISLALLAISAGQRTRIVPDLRQLAVVAQGVRREIAQSVDRGAALPVIQRSLVEIAQEQDIRIVLVDRASQRIVFDTVQSEDSWLDNRLADVKRPTDEFNNLDPALPIGRYKAPDGSSWILYSQQLSLRPEARFLLLAAKTETTTLAFFRQTFLRPLLRAGIIAFLLAALFAYLITRSVTKPLLSLADASRALAQGDYRQQVPLSGPEELQQVAKSFNAMAADVAASQQAQRDIVANVSHDLKTPLTSIRGWSQALEEGAASSPEERRRAAEVINAEAGRMEQLVEQLLDLARLDSGQMKFKVETIDLVQVLHRVRESYLHSAQDNDIQIVLNANPVPSLKGDYDRLSQVFSNLVENALQHTQAGGLIQVSLFPYGSEMVEIIIQDNGPGIPPDELDRVFERFYQVDKARSSNQGRRGSGLGLAIVKELVTAHRGRIAVHSQPGKGTTFTIHLPTNIPLEENI